MKNITKRQLRKSGGSNKAWILYPHTQLRIISNPSVEPNLSSIYARKQAVQEVRNLVTYCKICVARKLAHIQNPIQLGNTCNLFVIRDVNKFQVQHSVISRASFNLVELATHLHIHHHPVRLALINSHVVIQGITGFGPALANP